MIICAFCFVICNFSPDSSFLVQPPKGSAPARFFRPFQSGFSSPNKRLFLLPRGFSGRGFSGLIFLPRGFSARQQIGNVFCARTSIARGKAMAEPHPRTGADLLAKRLDRRIGICSEIKHKGLPPAVRELRLQAHGKLRLGQLARKAIFCNRSLRLCLIDAVGTGVEGHRNKPRHPFPRRARHDENVRIPAQEVSRHVVRKPTDPMVQMPMLHTKRRVGRLLSEAAGDRLARAFSQSPFLGFPCLFCAFLVHIPVFGQRFVRCPCEKAPSPTAEPIGTACVFFVRLNFLALAVPDEQVLRTSVFPNVFSRRDVFSLTILWYIASEIASALPLTAKKGLNSQKITRRPQQRKYKLQKIRKNSCIFCKNLAKNKRRVKFAMPRLSVHTYPPLMV